MPSRICLKTTRRPEEDWISLAVDTGNGYLARAITFEFNERGEISTFNIDSPINKCDTVLFTVNINLSEIQEDDVASPTLFGKFRVDNREIHDITYTLNIERGDDYISLIISDWSKSDSVLEEIMSGKTARFQFKIDGKAYYYRFSLKGSREALERQDQICRQLSEDDGDYFSEPEDDDDEDAVYFTA